MTDKLLDEDKLKANLAAGYDKAKETSADALFEIKIKAQQMRDMLHGLGNSREVSMAKTKLDELMMWVHAHVKPQEPGSGQPPPDGG